MPRDVIVAAFTPIDEIVVSRVLRCAGERKEKGVIYCTNARISAANDRGLKYIVLRRTGTEGLNGLFVGCLKEICRRGRPDRRESVAAMASMLAEKEGRPWGDLEHDPETALRIVGLRRVLESDNPLEELIQIPTPQGIRYRDAMTLGIPPMFDK